jgi:hypothetical protein
MHRVFVFLTAVLLLACYCSAQNLDSLMRDISTGGDTDIVSAAFKSSRLILSETTKMVKKHDLDFRVIHRFGDIGGTDGGSKTLFGIDNSADIYIGLEYGISDRFNIAFGRSKFEQLIDLQLKYAVLQQKKVGGSPLSFGLLAQTGFTPYKVQTAVFDSYSNRFSYFLQGIISRRFSPDLSIQVSPGILFRNVILGAGDEKALISTGISGRYKFGKRFGILVDYYLISSDYRRDNPNINYYSPLGLGFEIETGGHVFTLNFVNSKAISENNFLPNSTSSWNKGQYRFGFTISRMFTLYRSK